MKIINYLPKRFYVVQKDRLTEGQVNDAFSVANDNPLFRAAIQVLEDHIQDAIDITSTMKTSSNPGHISHSAGGIDALQRYKDDIINKQQTYGEKL